MKPRRRRFDSVRSRQSRAAMFQGRRASLAMRLRRVRFSSGPPIDGVSPSGRAAGSYPVPAAVRVRPRQPQRRSVVATRSPRAGDSPVQFRPSLPFMRAGPEWQGVRLLIGCVRVRAPGRALFIHIIVTQDRAFTASRAIRRRRRGATRANAPCRDGPRPEQLAVSRPRS